MFIPISLYYSKVELSFINFPFFEALYLSDGCQSYYKYFTCKYFGMRSMYLPPLFQKAWDIFPETWKYSSNPQRIWKQLIESSNRKNDEILMLINLIKTRLHFENKTQIYDLHGTPPDCFPFRIRWLFRALRSKICGYSIHNLFPLQLTKHKGFESVRWLLCWIINLIDLLLAVCMLVLSDPGK
jgi:hypothetical protein